jgi:Uma2 family endonuclease
MAIRLEERAGAERGVRERDELDHELLAAAERMELTEKGWVEKVTHPRHGRSSVRVVACLLRLGVPDGALYDNTRLARDPQGLRYVPDLFVVLPTNPVPIREGTADDDADYPGVPDLAVEILSPGDDDRDRDLVEKRRNYALRGIPHYWIVEPATGVVTWLALHEGAYVEQWTRPLAEVELPW